MIHANGRTAVYIAAVVFAGALILASVPIVTSHQEANSQRREFRAAAVLIARANCRELAIIRAVTLARNLDPAQRQEMLRFYRRLEEPINDALGKLGAGPCSTLP